MINLERTIDFSLLKFSNILTPEQLSQLEKKIYYQYTLIEPFVQNYIKTFSENIIKFTDYLNSTISYYDPAFLQLNNTITSIYYELSNIINDKYQIMDQIKVSTVMSFYYELLHLNETIEVKLSSCLAIALGFDFSVSFGLSIGMEDNSIFIDAYGEASLTISGEVYLFLGQKPVVIKAGIGISLLLASVRAGCKYTYEIMEKNHILDIYIEQKAFELNAYVFLEIKFEIFGVDFTFRVELAGEMAKGITYYSIYRKKIPVQGKSESSFVLDVDFWRTIYFFLKN